MNYIPNPVIFELVVFHEKFNSSNLFQTNKVFQNYVKLNRLTFSYRTSWYEL